MKTFKMLSLEWFKDGQFKNYPLEDGVIINQENSHRTWILEMYTNVMFAADFEPHKKTDDILEVRAVISYPDNEPAGFRTVVEDIVTLPDNRVSILLKGTLKSQRRQYAETLLEKLVYEEKLSGDELVERFRLDMKTRPRIT